MQRRTTLFVAVCSMIGMMTGCAVKDARIDSFVEPTYQVGDIKSVAIFPVQNASIAPNAANKINISIVRAMQTKSPNVELISPAEASRRINDAGIVSQWRMFIEDFSTAGLVNKRYLEAIAKALGTDAVMQGFIGRISQKDGMRPGDGIGITRVSVSYAIIDLRNAKIIWQSNATGRYQTGSFGFHVAPEVSETIDVALKKLTDNMPSL